MKYFKVIWILMFVVSCAPTRFNDDLLSEMRREIKSETSLIRQDILSERNSSTTQLKDIKSEMEDMRKETDKKIEDINAALIKNTNELQTQIFRNKMVVDEQAKRVYLIESVVTSKGSAPPEKGKEGFVTYIDGKRVAIALGSENNVNSGDIVKVYHGNEQVATIEVEEVNVNSSKGVITMQEEEVSIGDKVIIER